MAPHYITKNKRTEGEKAVLYMGIDFFKD